MYEKEKKWKQHFRLFLPTRTARHYTTKLATTRSVFYRIDNITSPRVLSKLFVKADLSVQNESTHQK